jgi:NAD(P)-dependent dehydrogenase (short-subunit alcohol dehydrogenase family)
MNVKNSVVLVTGANRGLGLAFIKAFKAAGASKIYAGMRSTRDFSMPGVIAVQLDVTSSADIERAAAELGDVNLLINNAGIALGASFTGTDTIDAARAELETNYFGPLNLVRAFKPLLEKNGGGAVVNVLSVLSWLNVPQVATYSASKAAAWSLTNGLRAELSEQGTQVVGVHVGYMDTDMASHIQGPKARPEDVVKKVLAALENGQDEVLADDLSAQVHQGLSANPAIYLTYRSAQPA